MREGEKLRSGAFICEDICLLHNQWLMALQVVRVCVGPPGIGELYNPAWFPSNKFVQITLNVSCAN